LSVPELMRNFAHPQTLGGIPKVLVPGGGVEPPRPEDRRILRAQPGFALVTDSFQNHSPSKVWDAVIVQFREGSRGSIEHTLDTVNWGEPLC